MSGLNQRIDVLCSDQQHPIQARLRTWCEQHDARLCGQVDELLGGDFLFLVSCQSIVSTQLRARYRYCLVVHASDLPTGRGMSPQVWQVISGAKHITVTLLNADDPVDSGDIWQQRGFELQGTNCTTRSMPSYSMPSLSCSIGRWSIACTASRGYSRGSQPTIRAAVGKTVESIQKSPLRVSLICSGSPTQSAIRLFLTCAVIVTKSC